MYYAAVAVAAAVSVTLGVLVAASSTQRRIGGLLIAHGVSVAALLGVAGIAVPSTASLAADQLLQGSWVFLFLWLVLIAYLLPDGRPPSARWRYWIWAGVTGVVLFLVGAAGDRQMFVDEHGGRAPPLPWLPVVVSDLLGVVGLVLVILLFFGSAVAVRTRLQRASGEGRLQLLWRVWGSLAVPLGLVALWSNYFLLEGQEWLTSAVLTGVSVALPAAIATAILRHRLFDIQVVLSRTLVYGVLVVGIIGCYTLLLWAAERLTGSATAGGLLAVAAVAVAVHPAYLWLRLRIERWVYGYRAQPHQALRLLADRAEAAAPDALPAAVAEAVAEALRVERVWVEDDAAAAGENPAVRVPLVHRGQGLGNLVIAVPPGRRLSTDDLALVRDLARYAAVLVHAERQSEQLRVSRSRIVASREEERRRLRRDLHDGVGPTLAAIVLKLNAAQSRANGGERDALLVEARDEVREAITEVRRLVDDLRPPAIDEVGLLAAI
jgi:signal transduction histidine kinase